MKKIVVCYKWVFDDEDIRVNDQDRMLNFDRAKHEVSEYDKNALEAGTVLKEQTGCEYYAVTCGADVDAALKEGLARGADATYSVSDAGLTEADSLTTATRRQ